MTLPNWREEPIGKSHDRKNFDCSDTALNEFFRKHARQNHESGGAKTFCAIDEENSGRVLGFYSLVPTAVACDRLPASVTKGLPRHDVGGFLLARIAIDLTVQRQGLGGQLLLAAGRRCLRVASEAGGVVMVIDAKSDRAAARYETYGAVSLEDAPLTLVMPLATIRAILEETGKL